MMAQWAAGWAAHQPDKPAIVHEGGIVTYAGLARRIERAAAALSEAGVGRGDRVAQLGLNSPDTLVLLFACARLGAILVTLNWRLTPAELQAIVGDCTPKLGWIDPDFAAALPGLPRLASLAGNGPAPAEGQDDDGVLLVYTSGTTGRPKGALLTQRAPDLERDQRAARQRPDRRGPCADGAADVPCRRPSTSRRRRPCSPAPPSCWSAASRRKASAPRLPPIGPA